MRRATRVPRGWLAGLVLLGITGCAGTEPVNATHPRTLARVSPDVVRARGLSAKVVADYGSFMVAAVDGDAPVGEALELHPEWDQIFLNTGIIDVTSAQGIARDRFLPMTERTQLYLVHFDGPISADSYSALRDTGATIVAYMPANTYLVWADGEGVSKLRALRATGRVSWAGDYLPADRVNPGVESARGDVWDVQLVKSDANEATVAWLRDRGEVEVSEAAGYVNVALRASKEVALGASRRPDVVSVSARGTVALQDEKQAQICAGQLSNAMTVTGPGYLAWLTAKGFTQAQFTASGFGVDVTDTGIDNGTTTPNSFALYTLGDVTIPTASRVSYARLEGRPNQGSTGSVDCFGHGDLVASVIGGYSASGAFPHADSSGYLLGLGMAPFVRLGSSVVFDPSFTWPNYTALVGRAYRDGMRISNNSWSANPATGAELYGMPSQTYDALVRDAQPPGSSSATLGNQEMTIVFAAGNAGKALNPVMWPSNAKNVITVGATDDASGVASYSSIGTSDGRVKPDLVAPGTMVRGALPQDPAQRQNPPTYANGKVLACAQHSSGVGSVPGEWDQQLNGTSFASPAVSAAAALVRQRFINEGRPPPSPAMTKAYLANSARFLATGGTLPSVKQGHGLLDLGSAFDGTPRVLEDQLPTSTFTATGQQRTYFFSAVNPIRPVLVTLAWTDAPGSTAAAPWANDLDLTVTASRVPYHGNRFNGAWSSSTVVMPDSKNNLESVFLPGANLGVLAVTVSAANIVADGINQPAQSPQQDYALVLTNAVLTGPASCHEYLNAKSPYYLPGAASGLYTIDPDGSGPGQPFTVYCDMVNDDGGWILISNLYHPSPAGTVASQAFGTPTLGTTNTVLSDANWALINQRLMGGGGATLRINGALEATKANLFNNSAQFKRANIVSSNCGHLLSRTSLNLAEMIHDETSGCAGTGLDYTYFGVQPAFFLMSSKQPDVCTGDCLATTSGYRYVFENYMSFWVREDVTSTPRSCKDFIVPSSPFYNPGVPSGTYTIDPDGSGPNAPFPVYCEMQYNGGGWMLISTLYDPSPAGTVASQSFGTPTPSSLNVVQSDANWASIKQAFSASATFTLRINGALEADKANLFSNYAMFSRANLTSASCSNLLNASTLALAEMVHDEVSGCTASGLDYTYAGLQPGFWMMARQPDACVGDCAKYSNGSHYFFENYTHFWVRE